MKGLKWKRFAKLGVLLTSLLATFVICSGVEAKSATNFGISDIRDSDGNWHSVPDGSVNKDEVLVTGGVAESRYNGLRFVKYLDWGTGKYFSGHAKLNITFRASSAADDTYNYTFDSNNTGYNVSCGLGALGTSQKSFSISNFNVTYLGRSVSGSYSYYGMLWEWDFTGESNISMSGSYDAYCQLEKTGRFLKIQYSKTNVYYENTNLTFEITVDESADAVNRVNSSVQEVNRSVQEVNDSINDLNDTINQQNQQDNQDRQDLENAQSDADSSADDSASQAESTGTTLLQAFTDFVGALTSASPSDCSINFNIMGYINGGNVNLCQLSLPPAFQTIGTLLLIGFCVPLSIATARKIISLFRSFQS